MLRLMACDWLLTSHRRPMRDQATVLTSLQPWTCGRQEALKHWDWQQYLNTYRHIHSDIQIYRYRHRETDTIDQCGRQETSKHWDWQQYLNTQTYSQWHIDIQIQTQRDTTDRCDCEATTQWDWRHLNRQTGRYTCHKTEVHVWASCTWFANLTVQDNVSCKKSYGNNNNNKQTLQGRTINASYVTKVPVATTKSRA